MGVEIKRVEELDTDLIEELIRLESEAFGEGGLNHWGLAPMIYHGAVYVIFMDKVAVGIAEYMRDIKDPVKAYLYGVTIDKRYHNQGLASRLLDYSFRDLKSLGIRKFELTVDPNNSAAIHLYQHKFGFKQIDYRKDEYGQGEDRVIMSR